MATKVREELVGKRFLVVSEDPPHDPPRDPPRDPSGGPKSQQVPGAKHGSPGTS